MRLLSRPLGSAPLLDSEPLPATRPGLLRPRTAQPRATEARATEKRGAEAEGAETQGLEAQGAAEPRTPEGFSLPAQRPAFDVGSGKPADIA